MSAKVLYAIFGVGEMVSSAAISIGSFVLYGFALVEERMNKIDERITRLWHQLHPMRDIDDA